MYTDHLMATKHRPTTAREQAMLAREQQKEMALLAGMYKAQVNQAASRFKLLLTGLFTGI